MHNCDKIEIQYEIGGHMNYKYTLYLYEDTIIQTNDKDFIREFIIKDYMNQDLCFTEYIEPIQIKASTEDSLQLIGELYQRIEGDKLQRVNPDEDVFIVYSQEDE
jgi:hypothetical protein